MSRQKSKEPPKTVAVKVDFGEAVEWCELLDVDRESFMVLDKDNGIDWVEWHQIMDTLEV